MLLQCCSAALESSTSNHTNASSSMFQLSARLAALPSLGLFAGGSRGTPPREGSAAQVFPAPAAGAGSRPQWPARQRGRPMLRGEWERGASSDKGAVLVTNLRRRIKGLATGRRLQLEGVRLHFGVYIHHCALVVKCSCIHAVLETE